MEKKIVEILKRKYWSKSDSFLLPLTGLKKSTLLIKSYLFWDKYSIEDYNLILTLENSDDYDRSLQCKQIFPILDKNGYLIETHDEDDKTIFVLDISEWALDIEMFLKGKYSKFSKDAKELIEQYHKFNGNNIPIYIYSVIYPNLKIKLLDNMTSIEYIAKNYELDLEEMNKIGEVGTVYDTMAESLVLDSNGTKFELYNI